MKRKNSKYEDLLDASRELFWKYGYKKVTIEEICRKASISKMTFYKFFSNKLELARAVFDREAAKGTENFIKIMNSRLSPAEKMSQILMLKLKGTHDISREFLSDFYNNPELGLKEHIENTTKIAWNTIIKDFRKAQEQGIFRKNIKPEVIWYFSQKMMEMINDDNLSRLFKHPQDMVMELAGLFMYGISSSNEK